jgi:hypothetical protein
MLGWVGLGAEDVLVFALFFLFMFRYSLYFLLNREANVEGRSKENIRGDVAHVILRHEGLFWKCE